MCFLSKQFGNVSFYAPPYHHSTPVPFCSPCAYVNLGVIYLTSCELISYISSIACAIAKSVPEENLAMLAAIFTQLGDTLTTIALHNDICNKNKND